MSDVQLPARGELFAHANPVEVLLKPEKFEEFYQSIVKETDALVPDVSTQRGRDAIKAVAFKVTKTKTFLDQIGKGMNEERRHEIDIVDQARRNVRDKLETLKETIRKPLTDWEAAETHRAQIINASMDWYRGILNAPASLGVVELERLSEEACRREVDPKMFGEETIFAEKARTDALAHLRDAIQRARQAEADRAELERLRSEAEARRQTDAERDRLEASRIAEERRIATEAAEAQRREQEAARRATEAAERTAAEERRKAEDIARAELLAERQRIAILEETERQRLAAEARAAEEQAAREADAAHRAEVMDTAQKAIMKHGSIQEARARKIVMAIAAGEVPNTRIFF